MEILVGIVIFGGLGYAFYRSNFGWWKKTARFPKQQQPPNMDAFTNDKPNEPQ